MELDEALKQQLVEARKIIIAQLDEMEFRATAKGIPRGGNTWGNLAGPPDYREVYAQLKDELRQINELLETDCKDDG